MYDCANKTLYTVYSLLLVFANVPRGFWSFPTKFQRFKNSAVLEPRTGNFQGLEASRPRTSKCVLEDVLETKDVLKDFTSVHKISAIDRTLLRWCILLRVYSFCSTYWHRLYRRTALPAKKPPVGKNKLWMLYLYVGMLTLFPKCKLGLITVVY